MNAPENITPPINAAHEVLLKSDSALCVEDVARAIVGKKPTKADIKPVAKLLKELADLGLIEMEPRAGGTPFYRLIAEPKACTPEAAEEMAEPLDFATSPEVQFLASEDYEMPPADPALLAMANRMQHDRLEGVAHALRGCGLPGLADASGAEDLQPKVAALAGAYQMALGDLQARTDSLSAACSVLGHASARLGLDDDALPVQLLDAIDTLRADLNAARGALTNAINEADRLRRELTDAQEVTDAAVGYLVRAPKRKPRYIVKPERAREAALAAVRAGAGRADVLAVVPVGTARRGAEWRRSKPRANGD